MARITDFELIQSSDPDIALLYVKYSEWDGKNLTNTKQSYMATIDTAGMSTAGILEAILYGFEINGRVVSDGRGTLDES